MHIQDDIKLDYRDVLIKPKRSTLSSRSEVNLNRSFKFRYSPVTWQGIPIIAANMSTVGTLEMANILHQEKMLTCLHKHYSLDQLKKFAENYNNVSNSIILSIGLGLDELSNLKAQLAIFPDCKFVCIDIANGYMQDFVSFVSKVREELPEKIIIAGNVVSSEMTEALIIAGADIIKVGIGSGAACTTRIIAGVGVPQLSAVIECADAAHGLGGHIIADGGCVYPGDLSKAFGGGADFVMLGSMLAGHDESGGEIKEINGQKFMNFYGMSSLKANINFAGGLKQYRAAEGRETLIPYKGSAVDTIKHITGGIRSTCTYIGAANIKEIPKRTTFVRINNQLNESLDRYTV